MQTRGPWRPGPLGSLEAGVLRELGERAIPPVHEQGVVGILGPVAECPQRQAHRPHLAILQHPPGMITAEHVGNEEVEVPVPVDVGEIHPHRKDAGLPDGQPRDRPEPPLPVISVMPVPPQS